MPEQLRESGALARQMSQWDGSGQISGGTIAPLGPPAPVGLTYFPLGPLFHTICVFYFMRRPKNHQKAILNLINRVC